MHEIQIDPRQDIAPCLKIYQKPNAVFGVTLLDVPGQKHHLLDNEWASGTIAGYFNNYVIATEAIFRAEQEMNPGMIVMSINPCKSDCLALANTLTINIKELKTAGGLTCGHQTNIRIS